MSPCWVFDQFEGRKGCWFQFFRGRVVIRRTRVKRRNLHVIYFKGYKRGAKRGKMANNSDEEDALDMSLKLGDRQLGVRESRSQAEAGNRRKIPLARIERRSLGGGEGGETVQKGEGYVYHFQS